MCEAKIEFAAACCTGLHIITTGNAEGFSAPLFLGFRKSLVFASDLQLRESIRPRELIFDQDFGYFFKEV